MEAADRSATPQEEVVDQPRPAEVPSPDDIGPSPELPNVSDEERVQAAIAEVEGGKPAILTFRIADDEPLELEMTETEATATASLLAMGLQNDDGRKMLALGEELLGLPNWFAVLRHIRAGGYKTERLPGGGFKIDEKVQLALAHLINDACVHFGLRPGESSASSES